MYCCTQGLSAGGDRCPKATFPSLHTEAECRLLSTMSKRDRAGFRQKPGWLALVRCALLRGESQAGWMGFQTLQDFTDEAGYEDIRVENMEIAKEVIRHLPKILDHTDKDQMARCLGIMDANSFRQACMTTDYIMDMEYNHHRCVND